MPGDKRLTPSEILDGLVDELASIEHERWAHWQSYMHQQGVRHSDGSLTLPADVIKRWEAQIETPFESLSESEKNSDRAQVERYLPLIKRSLEEAA